MTMPPPVKEHEWLQKLVGEWDVEGEMMEPGQPPQPWRGTEGVLLLGGFWAVSQGKSDNMPGMGPSEMLSCTGYDPRKQRYLSTFIGSMMADLWVSEGTLDDSGKVLTFEGEGPAMGGEGTARYRDVIEIKSDDQRVTTSYVQGADGQWQVMMTSHYRRKK